jgi:hypothetical protein
MANSLRRPEQLKDFKAFCIKLVEEEKRNFAHTRPVCSRHVCSLMVTDKSASYESALYLK